MNVRCDLLIMLIAFAGYIWQMTSLTLLFMKYEAANELTIEVSRNLPVPAITLCAYLPTLVNETKLRQVIKSYNLSSKIIQIEKTGVRHLSRYLKTSDYFQVTPRVENLWIKFQYRLPNDYSVQECKLNCSYMFTWRRYIHQYFMCYLYRQRYDTINSLINDQISSDEIFSNFRISNSLQNPKLHLQVDLNHNYLRNVSLFGIHAAASTLIPDTILSHPWQIFQYPFGYSRLENNQHAYNMLFVSYKFTRTDSLPLPYESNCYDYIKQTKGKINSSQQCLGQCIQRKVAENLHLMTTSALIFEATEKAVLDGSISYDWYKYPLYSSNHVNNVSIWRKYKNLIASCSNQCYRENCIDIRYFTELKKGEVSKENDLKGQISIRMYVPDSTTAKSKWVPLINLSTFIMYTLNSFSFWTGMSILSLHKVPSKLIYLCISVFKTTNKYKRQTSIINNHTYVDVNLMQNVGEKLRDNNNESQVKIKGKRQQCNKELLSVRQIVEKEAKRRIKKTKKNSQQEEEEEKQNQIESARVRRVRKRPPFDPREKASLCYLPRIYIDTA